MKSLNLQQSVDFWRCVNDGKIFASLEFLKFFLETSVVEMVLKGKVRSRYKIKWTFGKRHLNRQQNMSHSNELNKPDTIQGRQLL